MNLANREEFQGTLQQQSNFSQAVDKRLVSPTQKIELQGNIRNQHENPLRTTLDLKLITAASSAKPDRSELSDYQIAYDQAR